MGFASSLRVGDVAYTYYPVSAIELSLIHI